MMHSKIEAICDWFKGLDSAARIDVICRIFELCTPWELRFYGTCLEFLMRKDYHILRGIEVKGIDFQQISELAAGTLIKDEQVRSRLIIYLCLMHATPSNPQTATRIYDLTCNLFEQVCTESNGDLDDRFVEDFQLLLSLVTHHPAFSFSQRLKINDLIEVFNEDYRTKTPKCDCADSNCHPKLQPIEINSCDNDPQSSTPLSNMVTDVTSTTQPEKVCGLGLHAVIDKRRKVYSIKVLTNKGEKHVVKSLKEIKALHQLLHEMFCEHTVQCLPNIKDLENGEIGVKSYLSQLCKLPCAYLKSPVFVGFFTPSDFSLTQCSQCINRGLHAQQDMAHCTVPVSEKIVPQQRMSGKNRATNPTISPAKNGICLCNGVPTSSSKLNYIRDDQKFAKRSREELKENGDLRVADDHADFQKDASAFERLSHESSSRKGNISSSLDSSSHAWNSEQSSAASENRVKYLTIATTGQRKKESEIFQLPQKSNYIKRSQSSGSLSKYHNTGHNLNMTSSFEKHSDLPQNLLVQTVSCLQPIPTQYVLYNDVTQATPIDSRYLSPSQQQSSYSAKKPLQSVINRPNAINSLSEKNVYQNDSQLANEKTNSVRDIGTLASVEPVTVSVKDCKDFQRRSPQKGSAYYRNQPRNKSTDVTRRTVDDIRLKQQAEKQHAAALAKNQEMNKSSAQSAQLNSSQSSSQSSMQSSQSTNTQKSRPTTNYHNINLSSAQSNRNEGSSTAVQLNRSATKSEGSSPNRQSKAVSRDEANSASVQSTKAISRTELDTESAVSSDSSSSLPSSHLSASENAEALSDNAEVYFPTQGPATAMIIGSQTHRLPVNLENDFPYMANPSVNGYKQPFCTVDLDRKVFPADGIPYLHDCPYSACNNSLARYYSMPSPQTPGIAPPHNQIYTVYAPNLGFLSPSDAVNLPSFPPRVSPAVPNNYPLSRQDYIHMMSYHRTRPVSHMQIPYQYGYSFNYKKSSCSNCGGPHPYTECTESPDNTSNSSQYRLEGSAYGDVTDT